MGPRLIATLKAEETLFSLLMEIQKNLVNLFNVWHKLRCFFMKFSNCSKLPDVPNIRFCGLNGHLWSKLEVCLSIAYHVTIYKHFSSLRPLLVLGSHTSLSYLNAAVLFDYVFIHKYQNLIWFRSRLILLLPLFSSSCVFWSLALLGSAPSARRQQ